MVRSIVSAGAFLSLATFAAADIDFTPKESFYLAETVRVPNVAFRNGSEAITYSPPGHWALSGGGRRLSMSPPKVPQAEATLQTQPAKAPLLPATEANLEAYTEIAESLLPREASKVVVAETQIAPLKFSGRSMIEVTMSYVLFGQAFTTNILFLPYDKEQVTFQITARTPDFPPLAKMFRASLFSIQGL